MLVFLNCVRYNEDFNTSRIIILRFYAIHFIVILAGLKKIVCYTKDFFIIKQFIKSRFHCNQ